MIGFRFLCWLSNSADPTMSSLSSSKGYCSNTSVECTDWLLWCERNFGERSLFRISNPLFYSHMTDGKELPSRSISVKTMRELGLNPRKFSVTRNCNFLAGRIGPSPQKRDSPQCSLHSHTPWCTWSAWFRDWWALIKTIAGNYLLRLKI